MDIADIGQWVRALQVACSDPAYALRFGLIFFRMFCAAVAAYAFCVVWDSVKGA